MSCNHCHCDTEHQEEESSLKAVIRISLTALLLVAVWAIPARGWLKLVIFACPYILIGYDVILDAIKNILHGKLFDEEFLMVIATVGAFAIGKYPEAVAVMLFFQIGELIEKTAESKSRRSISGLMKIRPDHANLVEGTEVKVVSPETVKTGDRIQVNPGERIPLDGQIVKGQTSIDASALTGESLPIDRNEGDQVSSGTVNLSGVIEILVSQPFEKSTVQRILDMVQSSSEKKARAENFITRFSRLYTPFVVSAAVLLCLIPPIFFSQPWQTWIGRALVFLAVSCPCALVISVPLSFFGGIGGASRNGILIKGSNYLEALSHLSTVVFDKTGTLTDGKLSVTAIHPNQVSSAQLLDIAAAAESHSSHPIALSIIKAHGGHIDSSRIGYIHEMAGMGIEAQIDGRTIYIGNGKLMDSVHADWHECRKNGTVIHLAEENCYLGHIVISDTIKSNAADAIAQLKKQGVVQTVMLTGDTKKAAEPVARELGIDMLESDLLPGGKVACIESLLGKDSTVAFIGDGINDAPVLMRSDVGIAMGAMGSDAAIESADVVIMDDNISRIPLAMQIARKTMRIVHQNIFFAIGVKFLVIGLGAFGLAGLWAAVFADVGVMLIAVINSLRALRP